MMDGNVCLFSNEYIYSTHTPIDFLLTLTDVEGGFLYIKVANEYSIHMDLADGGQAFGYTDLMSCMLLDA